jgi:ferredoxin
MPVEDAADMTASGTGGFEVVVHQDRCIGAGHCAAHAPQVFTQDEEEGLVMLKDAQPSADRRDAVVSAARLCPVSAIEIRG